MLNCGYIRQINKWWLQIFIWCVEMLKSLYKDWNDMQARTNAYENNGVDSIEMLCKKMKWLEANSWKIRTKYYINYM